MPAYVRVHIFGSGPRARRVCAALVSDAYPQALVHSYEERRAAEAAAAGSTIPVVLLDARVGIEPASFSRFATGRGSRAAQAAAFDGRPAAAEAARRFDDGAALTAARATELPARESIGFWLEEPEPATRPQRELGVDLHSYGWGPTGLATAARNLMVGLRRAGVAVNWLPWFPEPDRAEVVAADGDLLAELAGERVRYDRAVVFHAPTYTGGGDFLETYLRAYARRPAACLTTFETDTIPPRWVEPLRACRRVWVPSSFNVETFVAGGLARESIDLVPIGLDVEHQPLDGPTLALPEERTVTFVSVFEWTLRKGWDTLLSAWVQAFTRDDDVRLVIRASYPEIDIGETITQFLTSSGVALERLAPIVVITEKLTAAQLVALYRGASAYVLPSRGEGFGLPYLEAMALGVPAIGTAWGGMTDFLDSRTGYPVEAALVPITSPLMTRIVSVFKDQRWAEPSVASLIAQLRRVYEQRDEAATIGARGAVVARARYNRVRIGELAAEALTRIEPPRLRAAVAAAPRFRLRGDFYSLDGVGAEARSILAALERSGFEARALEEGPAEHLAYLHRDDAARLHGAFQRRDDERAPELVACAPERMRTSGSRAAIARTVATEATLAPPALEALRAFDELWVPSGFSRDRFVAAGIDPLRVHVVPPAIDTARWVPQTGGLDVAPDQARTRMVLLTDWSARSGWELALAAFLRAFEADEPVSLTVKIVGEAPPNVQADVVKAAQRLAPHRMAALARYPLRVSTGVAPEIDAIPFVGSFDTLLACGREIGWGRPILEAMACGLTIVAPRVGNHRALLGEEEAYLIDAAPTAHPTRFEPDLDQLTRALRRIHDDRDEAYARGHRARRAAVANHALDVAGAAMRMRLEAYVERSAAPPPSAPAPPEPPLRLAVVIDARFEPESLERACAWVARMSANAPQIVVLRGDEPFAARLRETAERCDYLAYLRGDVVVGPAWDDFLIDALRVRPRIAFAVPRTFDVPGPQGGLQAGTMFDPAHLDLETDSGFAAFSRSISLVHASRGETLELFSTCAVMFDARSLRAAFARAPEIDSAEALTRASLAEGTSAWLAHDAVVQNGSSGARSMVAA